MRLRRTWRQINNFLGGIVTKHKKSLYNRNFPYLTHPLLQNSNVEENTEIELPLHKEEMNSWGYHGRNSWDWYVHGCRHISILIHPRKVMELRFYGNSKDNGLLHLGSLPAASS